MESALPASPTLDPDDSAILAADGESRRVEEVTAELERGLELVGALEAGRLRSRAFLRHRMGAAVKTEWELRHQS